MNTINDVKLFHETFNHPVADKPILMDEDRLDTRIDWMNSEIRELWDARKDKSLIEIADALADIQYFLSGTIIECGMGDLFPRIFAEVQRSNMSKACMTHEEAVKTVDTYIAGGVDCGYIAKDVKTADGPRTIYIIVRQPDGKTLKSLNWSAPDLSFINE